MCVVGWVGLLDSYLLPPQPLRGPSQSLARTFQGDQISCSTEKECDLPKVIWGVGSPPPKLGRSQPTLICHSGPDSDIAGDEGTQGGWL